MGLYILSKYYMKTKLVDKPTMKNGNPKANDTRKGRKNKKALSNELVEFYSDYNTNEHSHYTNNTELQIDYKYMSSNDKHHIENKFTKPKGKSQEIYNSLLKNKNKKIVVATGPAGTGKTLLATENGVRSFLFGNCEKLIFTRPSVSVDEDLGYLPGTLEEKMSPWVRPIYDILYNFISPKEVTELIEEKIIEISPLGYMRGRTFKNCWIIADEMQNSTVSQMKMLMTRIGENSRLVITGDLEQHDRKEEINGLEDFLNKFKGKRSSSISSFEFQSDDIQREEVVKEVLDIYESECIPPAYHLDNMTLEDNNSINDNPVENKIPCETVNIDCEPDNISEPSDDNSNT